MQNYNKFRNRLPQEHKMENQENGNAGQEGLENKKGKFSHRSQF